jgi:hypothetical protein
MICARNMPVGDLGSLLFVCVVLLLLVVLPRRELRSPGLSLLRCLFPAWRFFEEIADIPVLSHRVIEPGGAPGPWVTTLRAPARHATMLFLNAPGNLHLAQQSLVEHLAAQLEDAPDADPAGLTSYRLVQALVAGRIRGELPAGTGQYQFRLSDRDPMPDAQPLLLSQPHTL